MKTLLMILGSMVTIGIALLFILGIMSRSGSAPGWVNGRLAPCTDKPNCVCSEYKSDTPHYIEPISLVPTEPAPMLLLKNIISEMGGAVQTGNDTYLAATFTSAMFRFVDDLELRVDSDRQQIHIRSASRIGYSDMGVNRQRVMELKRLYQAGVTKK